MREQNVFSDGYICIGSDAEITDVAIGLEDANKLRGVVVNQLIEPLTMKTANVGLQEDENNAVTYQHYNSFSGAGSRTIPNADFVHEPSVFIGARLQQPADDRWQLTLVRNRNSYIDESLSEQRIRTIYKVICWGDQVAEAKRTVKVVRATPSLVGAMKAIETGGDIPAPEYKRIGFTSPLTPEDCDVAATFITRHVTRVRIERGLL